MKILLSCWLRNIHMIDFDLNLDQEHTWALDSKHSFSKQTSTFM